MTYHFMLFCRAKRGLQGASPCRNLGYRLLAFTHKIFKNSEKTIKYRFFRGRQSEKRSFSVPYSNYKLYFEDKCLESVLISVFSLFWFRFFSFARNKREKMNVKKTCTIQFFDLMLCLFFKLRCGFSDRLLGLLLPSALVLDDVLLVICYPAGRSVHQNDAFYITSFLTCNKMYLFYIFCISILHVF